MRILWVTPLSSYNQAAVAHVKDPRVVKNQKTNEVCFLAASEGEERGHLIQL